MKNLINLWINANLKTCENNKFSYYPWKLDYRYEFYKPIGEKKYPAR